MLLVHGPHFDQQGPEEKESLVLSPLSLVHPRGSFSYLQTLPLHYQSYQQAILVVLVPSSLQP